MKKVIFAIFALVAFIFTSCQQEAKQEKKEQQLIYSFNTVETPQGATFTIGNQVTGDFYYRDAKGGWFKIRRPEDVAVSN